MFHVTNGDSAAEVIRRSGVAGEILPWRDVLHDGPVPGDASFNQLRAIRARYLSDCGWRSYEDALRELAERDRALERGLDHDEIVLWFEHDLYDQLQLIQLLDWFATCELGATTLTLICDAEYLGSSTPERLAERFPLRREVTDDQITVARAAWTAFRSPDPASFATFLQSDSTALPFIAKAFTRHLEQFPSTTNGLSRTEQQALDAIATGATTLGDAFLKGNHQREDPIFLGDSSFAMYMAGLSNVTHPLLLMENGERLKSMGASAKWKTKLMVTPQGEEVRAGLADHVRLNGIDRWYGGVHIEGNEAAWRWDPVARRLRSS